MASATVTVQNVVDRCQEDLRDLFKSSGSTTILIEYADRIQQMILGRRRWDWMLSVPKRFITERGQTKYWIGTAAGQAAGEVDTALNLTDVRRVQQGSVLDRTTGWAVWAALEGPLLRSWQQDDASYGEGRPAQYRNDEGSPNVIEIFPAPDEGTEFLVVPAAPHATVGAGGALAERTYYIRVTFVDEDANESAASTTARQWIDSSELVTVKAPQPATTFGSTGIRYDRYNVYASTTEGEETLQNATPTAITADWTEPASGLTTTGADAPTDNELEPLKGYVIEFRYYKAHSELDALADTLLIPNEYRDVVVAGVDWLASVYLKRNDEAAFWQERFEAGVRRMTQDQNPWPGGKRFIRPDPSYRGGYRM